MSELGNYSNDDKVLCLIDEISKYADLAKKLNNTVLENSAIEDISQEKTEFENSFTRNIYKFISDKTTFINNVISGHLTYEQIKKQYNTN